MLLRLKAQGSRLFENVCILLGSICDATKAPSSRLKAESFNCIVIYLNYGLTADYLNSQVKTRILTAKILF
jgi:hypothetical protein